MIDKEEIGEVVGIHQTVVGDYLREFSDLKKSLKNLLAEGHPHLDVAECPHCTDNNPSCWWCGGSGQLSKATYAAWLSDQQRALALVGGWE